jgi:hypothetical protein
LNIISAISGHFGKDLVLGAFLPAVMFLLLFFTFVSPLLPGDSISIPALEFLDNDKELVSFFIMALILAGLIYNFSGPIIRFYEGYPWKRSLLGKALSSIHSKKLIDYQTRFEGYHALLQANQDPFIAEEWTNINRILNYEYPERPNLVLPTRLGNVIRSFERYSSRQYNIESIDLWPRLQGIIDKEYASTLDDALGSLRFLLNLSFLSGILAILILVIGAWSPPQNDFLGKVILPSSILAVLSYFFYYVSIPQAKRWGALFRGAFDLYRWDLLEKLGYTNKPKDRVEERELWSAISLQNIYGDRLIGMGRREPRISYCTPVARGDQLLPEKDPSAFYTHSINYLKVAKGIQLSENGTGTIVFISVRSNDQKYGKVGKIEVVDYIPEEFDYLWNSAKCEGRSVSVSGVNPIRFTISGILEPDQEMLLQYGMLPKNYSGNGKKADIPATDISSG